MKFDDQKEMIWKEIILDDLEQRTTQHFMFIER